MSRSEPLTNCPPRCWAEIHLSALKENARTCAALAGPNCGLMAIVKADAYGHGLESISTALSNEVDWFGVANVREAFRARKAAGDAEVGILILSPATPREIDSIVEAGFSGSVSSPEEVTAYARAAQQCGREARLHAVADTGMGRMGARDDAFVQLVSEIQQNEHCHLEGVETHFPSADEEPEFTREQVGVFVALLERLTLGDGCHIHLGNSAGLLGFQELLPFATLARPGLALYGISPLPEFSPRLRPALSLKSRIALIREIPEGTTVSYGRTFTAGRAMRVATLGIGYGDGYPRHLSGRNAEVLIDGKRCALLGRVTMDQIVVDISNCSDSVAWGDEVVVIGNQGDETITVEEVAEKAGTIPWEILTGITSRVERTYLP